ncbi:hypothetical protein GEO21_11505 [Sphingobacterium faecium]|uniref:hypothetical protein n=1 Tax=Sphingobacterium faecium TaxID=34087 RepID=UPI001290E4B8|nr:hypothetical protein [Sphingobacterium faecium]MQP28132.1 hypothetical protein [Sphingobacterium faecium]
MMIVAVATLAITGCKKEAINSLQREQVQGNWKMTKHYMLDDNRDTIYVFMYHKLLTFKNDKINYGDKKGIYRYTLSVDGDGILFDRKKDNANINLPEFVNADISNNKMTWMYKIKNSSRQVFAEFVKK